MIVVILTVFLCVAGGVASYIAEMKYDEARARRGVVVTNYKGPPFRSFAYIIAIFTLTFVLHLSQGIEFIAMFLGYLCVIELLGKFLVNLWKK